MGMGKVSYSVLALLVVGTSATSVACSKEEPEKKRAWACASVEVPGGESIRCTSQAATADGPAPNSTGGVVGTPAGSGGTTDGVDTSGTGGGSASAPSGSSDSATNG